MTKNEFIKFCKDHSLACEVYEGDAYAYLKGEIRPGSRELVFAAYRHGTDSSKNIEIYSKVHLSRDGQTIRIDIGEESLILGHDLYIETIDELESEYLDILKKYNDFKKQNRLKKIAEL